MYRLYSLYNKIVTVAIDRELHSWLSTNETDDLQRTNEILKQYKILYQILPWAYFTEKPSKYHYPVFILNNNTNEIR